jgi:hypothetical protein
MILFILWGRIYNLAKENICGNDILVYLYILWLTSCSILHPSPMVSLTSHLTLCTQGLCRHRLVSVTSFDLFYMTLLPKLIQHCHEYQWCQHHHHLQASYPPFLSIYSHQIKCSSGICTSMYLIMYVSIFLIVYSV